MILHDLEPGWKQDMKEMAWWEWAGVGLDDLSGLTSFNDSMLNYGGFL